MSSYVITLFVILGVLSLLSGFEWSRQRQAKKKCKELGHLWDTAINPRWQLECRRCRIGV